MQKILSIFQVTLICILANFYALGADTSCEGIIIECFSNTSNYWTSSIGQLNGTYTTKTNVYRVQKIHLRSGDRIDGIQLIFGDGNSTGYYGGPGGQSYQWQVSLPGECDSIWKVITYNDMHVNGIQFFTKKGRQSQFRGKQTGTRKQFQFPDTFSIHGMKIQANHYTNSLSFYISPNFR